MSFIEELAQDSIAELLDDEYLVWELYLPTKQIPSDFSNIKESLGSPVATFMASYPSQKPKQVIESSESGDAILQSTIYKIDILNLTTSISRKHILKIENNETYYEPTVALGSELIGRNIFLEVKLIK